MNFARLMRRIQVVLATIPPFLRVAFSDKGLFSADGRTLIRGKARRIFLSAFPSFSKRLQKHFGLTGGCDSCGASCNLLFQCPHWSSESKLCTVYEDRPNICRLFPITPSDIGDRNIVLKTQPCGFEFSERARKKNAQTIPTNNELVPAGFHASSSKLPTED